MAVQGAVVELGGEDVLQLFRSTTGRIFRSVQRCTCRTACSGGPPSALMAPDAWLLATP